MEKENSLVVLNHEYFTNRVEYFTRTRHLMYTLALLPKFTFSLTTLTLSRTKVDFNLSSDHDGDMTFDTFETVTVLITNLNL